MKTALRHIVSKAYKPLLVRYLEKARMFRYKDILLRVAPEVFHPGFFFTTRFLLQAVGKQPLKGTEFLELGCGSGLIAIYAAKQGAGVTATDINPVAIRFLDENMKRNHVHLTLIESNLFEEIPVQQFDIIAINPPFYKKMPLSIKDHAWYCGEHGEYFSSLFKSLNMYIHSKTQVLMVLFEGCDMNMITGFAEKNGFNLACIETKKNLLEKNFIFRIEKK